MGFKTFTDGALLPASDLNNYLMRQTVIRVADATEMAAIPSPEVNMVAARADAPGVLFIWTGTAWVNALGEAYATYTPSLTNMSIGNGSIVGRHIKRGRTVFLDVLLTCGSTTAASGTVQFGLPVTAANAAYGAGTGFKLTSASTTYMLATRLNTTTTFYIFEQQGSGISVLNASTTLGSTVQFRASMRYEAAS